MIPGLAGYVLTFFIIWVLFKIIEWVYQNDVLRLWYRVYYCIPGPSPFTVAGSLLTTLSTGGGKQIGAGRLTSVNLQLI